MDANMKTNYLIKNIKTTTIAFASFCLFGATTSLALQPPMSHLELIKQTDLIVEGQIIDIEFIGTKKINKYVESTLAKSTLKVSQSYDIVGLAPKENSQKNTKIITIQWQTPYKDKDLKKAWVGPGFAQFGEIGEKIYVYLKENKKDNTYSAVSYNAKCNVDDTACRKILDGVSNSASCKVKEAE